MAKMTLEITCKRCGKKVHINCDSNDYNNWKNNIVSIQTAFPYLTPDKREILLSRLCGDCFDELIPEEDESNIRE